MWALARSPSLRRLLRTTHPDRHRGWCALLGHGCTRPETGITGARVRRRTRRLRVPAAFPRPPEAWPLLRPSVPEPLRDVPSFGWLDGLSSHALRRRPRHLQLTGEPQTRGTSRPATSTMRSPRAGSRKTSRATCGTTGRSSADSWTERSRSTSATPTPTTSTMRCSSSRPCWMNRPVRWPIQPSSTVAPNPTAGRPTPRNSGSPCTPGTCASTGTHRARQPERRPSRRGARHQVIRPIWPASP